MPGKANPQSLLAQTCLDMPTHDPLLSHVLLQFYNLERKWRHKLEGAAKEVGVSERVDVTCVGAWRSQAALCARMDTRAAGVLPCSVQGRRPSA